MFVKDTMIRIHLLKRRCRVPF